MASHESPQRKVRIFWLLLMVIALEFGTRIETCPAAAPADISSPAEQEIRQEERERARLSYKHTQIFEIHAPEADQAKTDGDSKPNAGAEVEAALKEYNKWLGKKDGKIADLMVDMYKAAGGGDKAFKAVAFLIDKGMDQDLIIDRDACKQRQISEAHSIEMAKQRDKWIEEVIEKVAKRRTPPFQIARSDSGNVISGMKSDLDQTFFVFEYDEKSGEYKRNPDLDEAFVKQFNETWDRHHPDLSREALDIASFQGKTRFPDPRDRKVDFTSEFRSTSRALRRAPGAYTFQGAVVHQMQLRAFNEVLKRNPRAYQVYGPDEKGKWIPKPLDPDAAVRNMFGIEPDLLPGHAYGTSLANYLELQKYMHKEKFETKYHLRTAEDAIVPLAMKQKFKEGKVEWVDMDAMERAAFNDQVVDRVFTDPQKQELHKIAMNISTDLRMKHKGPEKLAKSPTFAGGLPEDGKAQEARIFEQLGKEMYGTTYDPSQHLDEVVKKHRELASEFCMESVYHSAREAFELYQDARFKQPFDVAGYRHLMSGVPAKDWPRVSENLRSMAEITFLYGIYDMGFYQSIELMRRLNNQFTGERNGVKWDLLYLWTRGRLQGVEDAIRDPRTAMEDARKRLGRQMDAMDNFMRTRAPELHDNVQTHVMAQLGFERVDTAEKVGRYLGDHKLKWSGRAFARNMFYDPGSIDALAQIVRAYIESKGDMQRVAQVTVDELIMAVPVAGQIVSASRSDITGLVLMGAAMQFPVAGIGLMVYSVGEAGYAMYDIEYRQHNVTNIENAIYRGFAGPATRAYDGAPPQFTDAQQAELDRLERLLVAEESRIKKTQYPNTRDPLTVQRISEQRAREEAEWQRVRKDIMKQIEPLRYRKHVFEKFRDDSAYGGYFSQWGAIKEQSQFPYPLLAEVPFVIGYSPAGIIDFRAKYDPNTDEVRLKTIEQQIKTAVDVETAIGKMAEYKELDLQKARYERAQRYLKKAHGRSGNVLGMTETEAKLGVVELAHKLQRDSLYPGLIELAKKNRATLGMSSVPNTDDYVDRWIEKHAKAASEALVHIGLLQHIKNEFGEIMIPAYISTEVVEHLKSRMESDYWRSKKMYTRYLEQEKQRLEKEEIRIQERLAAYQGQAAGLLIADANKNPDMNAFDELLTAMRIAAVKRKPPTIKSTVYMIRRPQGQASATEEKAVRAGIKPVQEQDYTFHFDIQVTADPHLYKPPYNTEVLILNKGMAAQAVKTGQIGKTEMLQSTKDALESILENEFKEHSEDEVLIPLINVYASGMPDLSQALPQTIQHLPGVSIAPQVNLGNPLNAPSYDYLAAALLASAAGESDHRFLMGQSFAHGLLTQKAGDLKIRTERDDTDRYTYVIVKSKTMATLDDQPSGKYLKYTVYVSESADDEFLPVPGGTGRLAANAAIQPKEMEGKGLMSLARKLKARRISKDEILIPDRLAWRKYDPNKPPAPAYYMASERWVTNGVEGPESFSDVSELGELRVRTRATDEISEGKYEATPASSRVVFSVQVGLADQKFDYSRVHIVAKAGGWTGHFYSGSPWVPYRPEGVTVGITIEAGGHTVAKSISFTSADLGQDNQSTQQYLERERKRYEPRIQRLRDSIAEAPNDISEYQQSLDKLQKELEGSAYWTNHKRAADLKVSIIRRQFQVQYDTQVRLPQLQAELQEKQAKSTKDWTKLIECKRLLIGLPAKKRALDAQRDQALAPIYAALYNLPFTPQSERESYQERLERDAERKSGPTRYEMEKELELWRDIVDAARFAGDIATLKEATLKWIDMRAEVAQEERESKRQEAIRDAKSVAGIWYQKLAEDIILLTNNREEAANYWIRGHEEREEASAGRTPLPGMSSPKRVPWHKLSLPTWFPESRKK